MNALRRQVEEMVEQKGEFVAMPQARAQTMHYMKGLKGAAALRRYCCTLTHLEDLDELIDLSLKSSAKPVWTPTTCGKCRSRKKYYPSCRVSSSRFWV